MNNPWEEALILRDRLGAPIPQVWDSDKNEFVPYKTAEKMEYYGASIDERPTADSVPIGAVFMAVQTQEIWQSDGVNWVVI